MAVEVSGVTFGYTPGALVLDSLSLAIASGASVALLGANGSGKSTLLKLLNGLLFPASGSIAVRGEPLTESALQNAAFRFRFRRSVGFVFQNADAQLFSPTVREELAFGPLQMGLARAETEMRVADVAALMEIEPLLSRPPFGLSGGEKRRVALASVLTINPDIILLDEPTSGLDPRARYSLAELLSRLTSAGKTLITATHDLDLVPRMARQAFVFSESGGLAAQGESEMLLADTALLRRVNLIY